MLDLDDDSVYTNLCYLLPALPAFVLGAVEWGLVAGSGLYLAYSSAKYHTTYERQEQGQDVSAMLTYLSVLLAVVLASWSEWALLLPLVAAPLHERYVWDINSYVAAPIYIALSLVALGLQVGPLHAAPAAAFALAGGAVKLRQPGPRTWLHSFWHVFGGLSAALALFSLTA